MDEGRIILLNEKKKERSKQVIINFPTGDNNYQVLDEDGNVKYTGIVQGPQPHIDDYCKCPNFEPLNNEKWISTHGFAYNCKHILRARELKFGVVA